MRKGIKSHWRPVYDSSVFATTTSGVYQTVLDLTASKKGRAAVLTGTQVYDWDQNQLVKITVDGVVIFEDLQVKGGSSVFQGVFDFEDSFKVEHKGNGIITRTDVAYYYFPN